MSVPSRPDTPKWFTLVVVIVALPALALPSLLNLCPPDFRTMVWVYPVYVVAAALLARQCYAQRPALAWVLVVLTLLSHAAVWSMIYIK